MELREDSDDVEVMDARRDCSIGGLSLSLFRGLGCVVGGTVGWLVGVRLLVGVAGVDPGPLVGLGLQPGYGLGLA
jgi:hypothetical protein